MYCRYFKKILFSNIVSVGKIWLSVYIKIIYLCHKINIQIKQHLRTTVIMFRSSDNFTYFQLLWNCLLHMFLSWSPFNYDFNIALLHPITTAKAYDWLKHFVIFSLPHQDNFDETRFNWSLTGSHSKIFLMLPNFIQYGLQMFFIG